MPFANEIVVFGRGSVEIRCQPVLREACMHILTNVVLERKTAGIDTERCPGWVLEICVVASVYIVIDVTVRKLLEV